MSYTTILHAVRKQFGLSCNEYCVADMIRGLSGNPESPVPGWCNASRGYLATELDLSRQSVITIIQKLIEKQLVEENQSKHLRSTALFYSAVTGCKETLQGVKKLDTLTQIEPEGVKNLDRGCKETLQAGCKETLQGGVKKLDTIIIDNNNTLDNTTNTLKEEPAVADAPVSEEEIQDPVPEKGESSRLRQSPKIPGEQKPPSSATPPTIVTQIRRLIEEKVDGYYWSVKDGAAAKQLASKFQSAILKKSGTCTDEDVLNALTYMIDHTSSLPQFFHFTDVPALNSKFNEIITQLRNNSIQRKSTDGYGKPVAPAHRSQQQKRDQVDELFSAIDDMVGAKQGR